MLACDSFCPTSIQLKRKFSFLENCSLSSTLLVVSRETCSLSSTVLVVEKRVGLSQHEIQASTVYFAKI